MIRSNRGYTFIELMASIVIIGLLAAAGMSYLRSGIITIAGHMAQVAMTNMASQQPGGKYPASVTLADLKTNGAGAILDDYVIDSYARTGTPSGSDYKLELKAPDGSTLICVTETSLTKAACT